MDDFVKRFGTPAAIVSMVMLLMTAPASAIDADLAIKCRDMAIKAHPPKQPGTKAGYAQAERDFFQSCVAKNGKMPDSDTQKDMSPAPK